MEVLWNYYYGMGKTAMIWIDDFKLLDKENKIKRIYEVIDKDFDEVWYLVRDYNEKSYIVKSKYGNSYAIDVMKQFKDKYNFFKISTELIKIYDEEKYPIVFKVTEERYYKYYDEKNNINNAFFNNYYCYTGKIYKAVRIYRNKIENEIFNKEDDVIYWCSNFELQKEDIISNSIRPLNLKNKVYDYEF